jgi:hypothetical protein
VLLPQCMSPKVAPLRHADCIGQCLMLGAKRKTSTLGEYFAV